MNLQQIIRAQKDKIAADTSWISNRWLDIAYAGQSPAQKLDIYLPSTGAGPFPVIVAIHGGAFKYGDKSDGQLEPMLAGLSRGYAVVSVNYRLSGESLWPAAIHDVKAAIRWLKAHASRYNLDSARIAAWGPSAGGHLAALIGTSADVHELEDTSMGSSDQSSRVQAVVDWFGPIDFLRMDDQFSSSNIAGEMHSTPESFESQLFGKAITDVPELVKAANPETYITPDTPPFFIQHGTGDLVIPIQQSINFSRKLSKVIGSGKVVFRPVQNAAHGDPKFEEPENIDEVFGFLDLQLK